MKIKDSRLKPAVEEEIRKTGSYNVLLSPFYRDLIKKTVIKKMPTNRAQFVWYDVEDGEVTSCIENDLKHTKLPRIGKVIEENRKSSYMRTYNKATRQFHLRMTDHDADVIEMLESCDNMQGYIKQLIRDDIARKARKKHREQRAMAAAQEASRPENHNISEESGNTVE